MKTIRECIGRMIGESSMCWSKITEAGVFDSDRAVKLTDEYCSEIKQIFLEMLPKEKLSSKKKDFSLDGPNTDDFMNYGYNQALTEIRERIEKL